VAVKRWAVTFIVEDTPAKGEKFFHVSELPELLLSKDLPAGLFVQRESVFDVPVGKE